MKNARFLKSKIRAKCWFEDKHEAEGILYYITGESIPSCKACAITQIKYVRAKRSNKNKEKDENLEVLQQTLDV